MARATTGERVVKAARGWIGTPYHDQASVKGAGCDCLGLVRGIWREVIGPEPAGLPPYSRDWGEVGSREVLVDGLRSCAVEISPKEAVPGALIVFRMRRRALAKHLGILTAPGLFVHSYERLGVIEEPLSEAWQRRVAHAFLFRRPRRKKV